MSQRLRAVSQQTAEKYPVPFTASEKCNHYDVYTHCVYIGIPGLATCHGCVMFRNSFSSLSDCSNAAVNSLMLEQSPALCISSVALNACAIRCYDRSSKIYVQVTATNMGERECHVTLSTAHPHISKHHVNERDLAILLTGNMYLIWTTRSHVWWQSS